MADVELDAALQKEILAIYARLDELDHYALLGVAREVDRKGVKAAYYALAAKFHTDKHYGKKLGDFKPKLEQIFAKVTIAHDVLSNRAKRAEYDLYLVERDRTAAYEKLLAAVEGGGAIEALLAADPEPQEDKASGKEKVAAAIPELMMWRKADLDAHARKSTPPPVAGPEDDDEEDELPPPPKAPIAPAPPIAPPRPIAPSRPIVAPIAPPVVTEPARATSAADDEARRRVLASRFGRRPTGAGASQTGRRAATVDEARTATEGIKQRYLDAKQNARKIHARRLVQAANEALAKDDFVAAANQYRLALELSDEPSVRTEFERVNRRAREIMAEAYAKQAKYEEEAGKWKEAASSYEKACEGRPDDADLFERAAHAHRRLGRDLHRAARYAETAVQKNPSKAAFRVTLGSVYLDAGLVLRAKSELEQAIKLAPDDPRAKELLALAKKTAV